VSKLDTLFDISAPDAIEEIMKCRILSAEKKQEDLTFTWIRKVKEGQ